MLPSPETRLGFARVCQEWTAEVAPAALILAALVIAHDCLYSLGMLPSLEELQQTPESESAEKKGALDPTVPGDILGLVSDIAAIANTHGGWILIGTEGKPIPETHAKLFDGARIDDKVNSYVEPRIGGISSTILGGDFVVIEVEKSKNPPHVFRREGNYQDEKKQVALFRAGDIFVRHSSKSERAERSDLDRMFVERQRQLLERAKMVFEAPVDAPIRVGEEAPLAVRIDPADPDAQPVYEVLTGEPFANLHQELLGGLKAWKTSRHLLNEPQIVKAYQQRANIRDPEVIELILRSCWEHRLPGYYWASRIDLGRLYTVLEEVIRADPYPAVAESLRVASLLPRDLAKSLLGHADNSPRASTKSLRQKLEKVLRARARRHATLAHLYAAKNLKYKVETTTKEVRVDSLDVAAFEEILGTLPGQIKENRGPFRVAELMAFGQLLTELQAPEPRERVFEAKPIEPVPEEPSSNAVG